MEAKIYGNFSRKFEIFQSHQNSTNLCESTILKAGTEMYLHKMKNDIKSIYKNFKRNFKPNYYQRYLLTDNTFNFGSIVLSYYVRGIYQDLDISIKDFFESQINRVKKIVIAVFAVFLLHFLFFLYFVFIDKLEYVYFYFEKMRVIISIVAKDDLMDKIQVNKLIENFF